jgi:2-(1,2-epoxy-1,2-dihydrophenyl)acetyl-CoA isomerase
MYQHLIVSNPAEKIFQITINRPRQLNALGRITFQELAAALTEFDESDREILLLTGSGRAFCFGADFTEFQDRERLPELLHTFQELITKLFHSRKVTVAALNGFATGAGFDLALACDFRIAAEKVKMGEAYINMGLVPDGGGSFLLTKIVGVSRALEMLALGEAITAEQALSFGIVHQVVPAEELMAKSVAYASQLAAKPQTALRQIKKLIKEYAGATLESALENERQSQLICFEDETHQSIVREFLAKRQKN